MKNKKIIFGILVGVFVVIAFWFFGNQVGFSGASVQKDFLPEIGIDDTIQYERKPSEEYYVYESDAESADECTSYEYFDAERSVCAFECQDDAECAEIEKSIDAEISDWGQGDYAENPPSEKPNESEEKLFASYSVKKGEKVDFTTDDIQQARDIWQNISRISPDTLSDGFIETYGLFDDAKSDVLAYVDDNDMNGRWRIVVNTAGYEDSTLRERNLTIVHELGHIITLNNKQVKTISESKCAFYYTAEGCADTKSYLGGFVTSFWTKSMIQDSLDEKDNLYKPGTFITEYAATNPEEDLAESFAYYVIGGVRTGSSIEDKKVNYFAQFPEIVSMRDQMLSGVRGDIIRARQMR